MEARGLAAMRARSPGEAPESGGFMDYLIPLTVSAITTAALAAVMTPAGAAAVAPTIMGSTIAGSTAAGVGGATAGKLSQDAMATRLGGGVAPGMGQPAPRPEVRQTQGAQAALQQLSMGSAQPAQAQPAQAQQLPERDPEEQRVSRVAAMMKGFGVA